MRRRRLTVWLLLLVAAHGARTADPLVTDPSTSSEGETTTDLRVYPYSAAYGLSTWRESMLNRGNKKFGDKCEDTQECGFRGSICDSSKKSCQCLPNLPATNHIDKCGTEVGINESCFFNEQCEMRLMQTECKDGRCWCRFELTPILNKQNSFECVAVNDPVTPETYVDPAMIGVLVGMALMFVIICVVLRLFSKARWRENRTIFNTPNPRLMNVSLLRDNKHPNERRGSRSSNRAPSRQPSMASLRPQSPNASQGSRPSCQGSRCSSGSLRSPTKTIMTNNYTSEHKQPNDVNV